MVDFKSLVAGAVMMATGGAASADAQENVELESAPQADNVEMTADARESSALKEAKAAFAETGLIEAADIIDEIGETAVETNPTIQENTASSPKEVETTNLVEESALNTESPGVEETERNIPEKKSAGDVETANVDSTVLEEIAEIKANDPLGTVTTTSETPQSYEAALEAAANQLEGVTGGQDADHSDVSKSNVEASQEAETGQSR